MLHQKYVVEGASIEQIAKELSCSKGAIRRALKKAGIPIRGRVAQVGYGTRVVRGRRVQASVEQKVIDTILEMRQDGMTYTKIASFLTKMGVPTKNRRRKWNPGCVRVIYLSHRSTVDEE